MRYDELFMTIIFDEKERWRRGCGYKYVITSGCTAHKAYRTKAGLYRWMRDAGLTLGKRSWLSHSLHLEGAYSREMMLDAKTFAEMRASGKYRETVIMSNGQYTTGLVEEGKENSIYYLNPNVKSRDVHDYNSIAK